MDIDNELESNSYIEDDLQISLDKTFQEWNQMEIEYNRFKIEQKTTDIYKHMYGILYLLTFIYLYKKTFGLEVTKEGSNYNIISKDIEQNKFQELVIRHNILFNFFFFVIFKFYKV